MAADPQAPKDGRIAVWPCGHGNVYWEPGAAITGLACAQCGARATTYVPASVVDALREERDENEAAFIAWRRRCLAAEAERDTARDALREIANALQHGETVALDTIAGIIANGPLATAPGGDREDECFRLRAERDAARAEVARKAELLTEIIDVLDELGAPHIDERTGDPLGTISARRVRAAVEQAERRGAERAEDESAEPMFVLHASDDLALLYLRDYALACAMPRFEEKGRPAVEALEAFMAWRREHGLDLEVEDAVA